MSIIGMGMGDEVAWGMADVSCRASTSMRRDAIAELRCRCRYVGNESKSWLCTRLPKDKYPTRGFSNSTLHWDIPTVCTTEAGSPYLPTVQLSSFEDTWRHSLTALLSSVRDTGENAVVQGTGVLAKCNAIKRFLWAPTVGTSHVQYTVPTMWQRCTGTHIPACLVLCTIWCTGRQGRLAKVHRNTVLKCLYMQVQYDEHAFSTSSPISR